MCCISSCCCWCLLLGLGCVGLGGWLVGMWGSLCFCCCNVVVGCSNVCFGSCFFLVFVVIVVVVVVDVVIIVIIVVVVCMNT